MGYRAGDETVVFEASIEKQSEKAWLLRSDDWNDDKWIPKSQVVSMSDPDADGLIEWTVTEWIAKKNGLI